MRIERIDIKNYGPFLGKHSFQLSDRGLTLVMGDNQDEPKMNSNGAGKSSIFDALDWCLFGKVPRGDHVDSIRNEESKDECGVSVILFDDEGKGAWIQRSRDKKKTHLLFAIDGVEQTRLDNKETQVLIEQYLGLNREVFHAAVLFGQLDLAHYADSTDTERMDILTNILQLDEIDELKEVAKAKLGDMQLQGNQARQDWNSKRVLLESLQAQNFHEQIVQWNQQHADELKQLEGLIQLKAATVAGLGDPDTVINGLSGEKHKVEARLRDFPKPNRQVVETEQANRSKITTAIGIASEELSRHIAAVEAINTKINAGEMVCGECGQVVALDHLQAHHTEASARGASAHEEVQQLQQMLQDKDNLIAVHERQYADAVQKHQESTSALSAQLATIESSMQQEQQKKHQLMTAQTEWNQMSALFQKKQQEVNPYVAQQQNHQQQIVQVQQEIEVASQQLQAVTEEEKYLQFWVDAFSAKGLKSYILDSRLQELSVAANQWVTLLSGGTIWVEFRAQKETRGKKLVNSPDIRVFRWNPDQTITERNYRSWSGGEKQRISFAIDFGLSRLIAQRAKQSYDLLILDEVFKHLDQSGKEAVVEMLQVLAQEKSSVFVVEHDTDFQSSFDNRIVVQKKNRRSVILEESHAQEEREEETATFGQEEDQEEAQGEALPVGDDSQPKRRPLRTPV